MELDPNGYEEAFEALAVDIRNVVETSYRADKYDGRRILVCTAMNFINGLTQPLVMGMFTHEAEDDEEIKGYSLRMLSTAMKMDIEEDNDNIDKWRGSVFFIHEAIRDENKDLDYMDLVAHQSIDFLDIFSLLQVHEENPQYSLRDDMEERVPFSLMEKVIESVETPDTVPTDWVEEFGGGD